MTFKILLAGDGGQGIQLIADAISEAAFLKNWYVTSVSNYGLEQRGGVSLNFVIVSDRPIGYSKFKKPDVLLLMSEQARERTDDHQQKGVKILDYKKYQEKMTADGVALQSQNIFFLGVLSKILEEHKICSKYCFMERLEERLSKKSGWENNKKAFELGCLIK